ncbi:MAG TPA: alpha/beta fold hydrolase [Ktedonobacterales bacterium]|nr:alpha/beta fold hydrolase [Ktedonobacterales bacterium]
MSQSSSTPKLSLDYLTRPPQTEVTGKPPLLLQLHGIGSNERDLFSFADRVDPRFRVLSLRAPLTLATGGFAWFEVTFRPEGNVANVEQLAAARERLLHFIQEAVAAYDADPERVYLIGFSQGAIMSLALALTSPAVVAGVVAMSGRIPTEAFDAFQWSAPNDDLAGLPILLLHGTRDAVVRVQHAHHARNVLEKLPVALTYHEYDMAHEVTPRSLALALAWLMARLNEPRRQPQASL